jgi:hypothetical protein
MKKFLNLKSLRIVLLLYVAFDVYIGGYCGGFLPLDTIAAAQTSLTQTTLASAQGIGPASLAGGSQAALQTTISVASATGIQTAAFGAQPVTFVYVDKELEGILSLQNGQTTIFNVLRAQGGTLAAYHASGTIALVGTVTPQFGGFAGSGGFQQIDAPFGGVCAGSLYTPWVNVVTGAQWLCSSITGTWVPGWNNPLVPGNARATAAVASAASTLTPTGPLFHITGTTTGITGFTIPVGFNGTAVGGGQFCVIPDGAWTTVTGGPAGQGFKKASTAVIGQTMCFTYDPVNLLWDSSY